MELISIGLQQKGEITVAGDIYQCLLGKSHLLFCWLVVVLKYIIDARYKSKQAAYVMSIYNY